MLRYHVCANKHVCLCVQLQVKVKQSPAEKVQVLEKTKHRDAGMGWPLMFDHEPELSRPEKSRMASGL